MAGMFGVITGKNDPQRVTVHILDPNHGYVIQTWTAGEEVSADLVARRAQDGNLYVVYYYKPRRLLRIFCKKEQWLRAKAEFDTIQENDPAGRAGRSARFNEVVDRSLG
jgi:hypothetical protein